jgi:hypothetical protein
MTLCAAIVSRLHEDFTSLTSISVHAGRASAAPDDPLVRRSMSESFTRIAPWVRDVGLAYVGGLVLGAPVAALVAWATGIEQLTTWCLLGAMALVLRTLRQQRRQARIADAASPRAVSATAAPARHAA